MRRTARQNMKDNPNDAPLKTPYEKCHGSLDRYEEYGAAIEERLQKNRKEQVLAQRIEIPDTLSAFTLETLKGDTLSANRPKEKGAVINV